jgi:hypothetical protein
MRVFDMRKRFLTPAGTLFSQLSERLLSPESPSVCMLAGLALGARDVKRFAALFAKKYCAGKVNRPVTDTWPVIRPELEFRLDE